MDQTVAGAERPAPLDASETLTLEVTGMTCGGCVRRAEGALAGLPGTVAARVNLATRKAEIDHDGSLTPAAAATRLAEAGYPASETTLVLHVEGATCGSCAARIEAALAAVPGVTSASFNLANGTARARVLTGAVTVAALIAAVEAAGYGASEALTGTSAAEQAEARQAAETAGLRRDTLISAALSLPVVILAMGAHLVPGFHHWIAGTIGMTTSNVLQCVLTTLVLAWPGARFFRLGLPTLRHLAPDMNALVVLGTSAAWIYSTVATFAPAVLPEGAAHVYFEAAAVIVTLILAGRWMEARARGRASAAIRRLAGLQVREALLVAPDGSTSAVPVSALQPGDLIALRPGDRLPVDGVVTEGVSDIDESMVTGEPIPATRRPGDAVIGGTVNGASALVMRATATGADTMLSRIMAAVDEAQGAKLPVQNLVDRVAQVFVPAVIAIAALTFALWLALGGGLGAAVVAAVSVLVVACPCAMGLAVPVSIMVGTGRASELGVLFRRGDALQRLREGQVVAFDKTGTLTLGKPRLTGFLALVEEDRTLARLAALESRSEHPLGRAVVAAAAERGLDLPEMEGVKAVVGEGLAGRSEGIALRIGNRGFVTAELPEALARQAEAWEATGATVLFAEADGAALAVLAVSDVIRDEAPGVIAALKAEGLRPAMITGDSQAAAAHVAGQLGIDLVRAEVRPTDKAEAVTALRGEGPVIFVGDGINDAPALAAADVGVAMGSGTDVAMEAADVVLIGGALQGVPTALTLSRRTMANIRQNLFWAFAYNVALIPVAAGVLAIWGGPMLSPMLASAAMAASSVLVVGNALRLRRVAHHQEA
ncbi:heavy metal translocating P-type ATPase [Oceanicola sp. S124]|uniref:heavy metal translocating P-type ATPase n=1 Tax=Oceanicola sp. S124 TaxID=1042378 RepID=UPI0002559765|nr:heavy metal translocating P-type ATPase [Oceanicola sp. S124]